MLDLIKTGIDNIDSVKPDFESDTHKWWLEDTFSQYHNDKLFSYIVKNKKTKELDRVLTDGKKILYVCKSIEAMGCHIDVLILVRDKNN